MLALYPVPPSRFGSENVRHKWVLDLGSAGFCIEEAYAVELNVEFEAAGIQPERRRLTIRWLGRGHVPLDYRGRELETEAAKRSA